MKRLNEFGSPTFYLRDVTVYVYLLNEEFAGDLGNGLGLVHTFRFSTGRQVPLIAGQSSGIEESICVFTQPGRLARREFTGRLPASTRAYPLLCPVAGRSIIHQWCTCCLYRRSHTPVYTRLYQRDNVPLQCQQSTGTVVFQW